MEPIVMDTDNFVINNREGLNLSFALPLIRALFEDNNFFDWLNLNEYSDQSWNTKLIDYDPNKTFVMEDDGDIIIIIPFYNKEFYRLLKEGIKNGNDDRKKGAKNLFELYARSVVPSQNNLSYETYIGEHFSFFIKIKIVSPWKSLILQSEKYAVKKNIDEAHKNGYNGGRNLLISMIKGSLKSMEKEKSYYSSYSSNSKPNPRFSARNILYAAKVFKIPLIEEDIEALYEIEDYDGSVKNKRKEYKKIEEREEDIEKERRDAKRKIIKREIGKKDETITVEQQILIDSDISGNYNLITAKRGYFEREKFFTKNNLIFALSLPKNAVSYEDSTKITGKYYHTHTLSKKLLNMFVERGVKIDEDFLREFLKKFTTDMYRKGLLWIVKKLTPISKILIHTIFAHMKKYEIFSPEVMRKLIKACPSLTNDDKNDIFIEYKLPYVFFDLVEGATPKYKLIKYAIGTKEFLMFSSWYEGDLPFTYEDLTNMIKYSPNSAIEMLEYNRKLKPDVNCLKLAINSKKLYVKFLIKWANIIGYTFTYDEFVDIIEQGLLNPHGTYNPYSDMIPILDIKNTPHIFVV